MISKEALGLVINIIIRL